MLHRPVLPVAPQTPVSHSAAAWQICALVLHVPVLPVAPHTPVSHSACVWQICAFVEQLPSVAPVPVPQELLSQSLLT